MVPETKTRLRASCNACNESKVRCSQSKPTCTRCERNDIECVYGLSRRTHKDAPPISTPPSQRARKPRQTGNGSHLSSSSTSTASSTNNNSPNTAARELNGGAFVDRVELHNSDAGLFADYIFPSLTEAEMTHGSNQMPDFSNIFNGSNGGTTLSSGYFSTVRAEHAVPPASDPESFFAANRNNDLMNVTSYQPTNYKGNCSCHVGVTDLLAAMRSGSTQSYDRRSSVDTQLAKLRQCIAASEASIKCTHGQEDAEPIHIMAVAMLIGYAIDDYKTLAGETSTSRLMSLSSSSASSTSTLSSPSIAAAIDMASITNAETWGKYRATSPDSTGISPDTFMEPRLSWGVLELEEDDEMDLRHRLYLLSFRKLERLLLQLNKYIQDLHNALLSLPDPSQNMAFVMVCDYTRLWLEKKAGDVKRLFLASRRDHMLNSMCE